VYAFKYASQEMVNTGTILVQYNLWQNVDYITKNSFDWSLVFFKISKKSRLQRGTVEVIGGFKSRKLILIIL